jgi:hypothetical protein
MRWPCFVEAVLGFEFRMAGEPAQSAARTRRRHFIIGCFELFLEPLLGKAGIF